MTPSMRRVRGVMACNRALTLALYASTIHAIQFSTFFLNRGKLASVVAYDLRDSGRHLDIPGRVPSFFFEQFFFLFFLFLFSIDLVQLVFPDRARPVPLPGECICLLIHVLLLAVLDFRACSHGCLFTHKSCCESHNDTAPQTNCSLSSKQQRRLDSRR